MNRIAVGNLVGQCSTLAILLEVSSYPKPGNVHRTVDFPWTRYEHFLAGAVGIEPFMRQLAIRGYNAARSSESWSKIRIGEVIFKAVESSRNWQSGGNVNLGTILLISPLAAASGAILSNRLSFKAEELRQILEKVIQSTSQKDAVSVCKAISTTMSERVLGRVNELDLTNSSTIKEVYQKGLTLMDIFSKCMSRDLICREWVTRFEIVFTKGYPTLKSFIEKSRSINSAIINTFLTIQSEYPDSLVIRKAGVAEAQKMSERAKEILDKGGAYTEEGSRLLWNWDQELRKFKGRLNPGTTADLVAASAFLLLVNGWRP
ncbi:triphosphoribosyl-dephospho-CoA synthase [Candidatus Bathyarchaeota archaeon]|nr:triphosphoribosyl-dephospho-CoA synthase [Candidatus Bathyarchaeota archaeon]